MGFIPNFQKIKLRVVGVGKARKAILLERIEVGFKNKKGRD